MARRKKNEGLFDILVMLPWAINETRKGFNEWLIT